MIRFFRGAVVVLSAALLLAITSVGPTFAAGTAQVRVLHASPDAPAVDVWLDGSKVSALTDVPFGAISDYLTVAAGARRVQVFAIGTSTNPVIDTTVDLAAGSRYTIAATNDLAHIQAQVLLDNAVPTANRALVRVVHFSADAPAVDVAPRGAAVADALVKGLTYPKATGYLAIPGGTYDLDLRLAGTTTVALALPPLTVADGTAYSVFAIGSAANPPVGGHGLRVVVARDAAVASAPSPAPSLPPTSTLGGQGGTGSPSGTTLAVLLMAATLLVAAGTTTLVRVRSRN